VSEAEDNPTHRATVIAAHRTADTLLLLSDLQRKNTEVLRRLRDLIDREGDLSRETLKDIRRDISALSMSVDRVLSHIGEARGTQKDAIGNVDRKVDNMQRDITGEHNLRAIERGLKDRRHRDEPRTLGTITVGEVVKVSWPIFRKLLPFLATTGAGMLVYRFIRWLKVH